MSHVGEDAGTSEEELPVEPQADEETWPEGGYCRTHLGLGSKLCQFTSAFTYMISFCPHPTSGEGTDKSRVPF